MTGGKTEETVMVIEGAIFDLLEWEEVDGMELNSIVEGLTAAGSEPVGYPLTDGVLFYLQSPAGELMILKIDSDPIAQEFYISVAHAPRGEQNLQEP